MKLRRFEFGIIFAAVFGLVLTAYSQRGFIRDRFLTPSVPEAEERVEAVDEATKVNRNVNQPTGDEIAVALPSAKNLKVPFTSQAPHGKWDGDHNEFCEEASVVMVGRYWTDRTIASADEAEAALQQIKTWEIEHLGFFYDTTADEVAKILEGMYDLKVEVKRNPTVEDIKRAVAAGKPVIVPSAGRELGNPNFRQPGPIYHMLVIRGYTADGKFITNDPGTRKGEQYVYDTAVVMNAMHDWVPAGERMKAAFGDTNGDKVVLIAEEG